MEGYPWGNGNDRAGLWQWDYATPKEVGRCCWEGQGDRLERGQGEVLRRHPSWALVPGLPLLREGGGRQGDLSASASPPREMTTSPLPVLLSPTCPQQTLIFLPPSTSLGRKSAPSSQAQSPRSNIQEAGTQKGQRSHLGRSIFGHEGASPGPRGWAGETGRALGQAVRYTPQEG